MSGRGLFYTVDLINGEGTPIVPEDRYSAFTGDLTEMPNNIIAGENAKRGEFLGGITPNTIKLGPPFTITQDEIDLAIDSLDQALEIIDEKFIKN